VGRFIVEIQARPVTSVDACAAKTSRVSVSETQMARPQSGPCKSSRNVSFFFFSFRGGSEGVTQVTRFGLARQHSDRPQRRLRWSVAFDTHTRARTHTHTCMCAKFNFGLTNKWIPFIVGSDYTAFVFSVNQHTKI
jgi:hypothetical protein